MKNIFLFFLFTLHFSFYNCQTNTDIKKKYEGSKCNDIAINRIISDSLYYEGNFPKIKNDKTFFKLESHLNYPQAFNFYSKDCNKDYGLFLIHQNTIIQNFDEIKSKSLFPQADHIFKTILKKFENDKKNIYDSISSYMKANKNILSDNKRIYFDQLIRKNEELRDESIYKYTLQNTDSFFVLWYLVYSIEHEFYYNSLYSKIYESLSLNVKKSLTGKKLFEKIKLLNKIQVGNIFPLQIIKDNNLVESLNDKKYILVDFWFSYCSPCLEEFPKYKKIYDEYKSRGFEMIGISTDRSKDIGNWKKVIKEKDLIWLQTLDENGIASRNININKFPTVFLLDSKKNIIRKDISPKELEMFLEENLK